MINKFQHLSALLIVCIIFSCCKDKTGDGTPTEQLPPETQTGENTFGCLWNGQVWVAHGTIAAPPLQGDYSNGMFNIYAVNKQISINQAIGLFVDKEFNSNNSFIFKIDNDSLPWAFCADLPTNCTYFTDTLNNTGHLYITKFDTINRIISGTFDMILAKDSCGDINITDGRFDIRYPV